MILRSPIPCPSTLQRHCQGWNTFKFVFYWRDCGEIAMKRGLGYTFPFERSEISLCMLVTMNHPYETLSEPAFSFLEREDRPSVICSAFSKRSRDRFYIMEFSGWAYVLSLRSWEVFWLMGILKSTNRSHRVPNTNSSFSPSCVLSIVHTAVIAFRLNEALRFPSKSE